MKYKLLRIILTLAFSLSITTPLGQHLQTAAPVEPTFIQSQGAITPSNEIYLLKPKGICSVILGRTRFMHLTGKANAIIAFDYYAIG